MLKKKEKKDPGTAAPKRRPGTAGDIDEALTAIDKGFGRAWGPLHGQAGWRFSVKGELRLGLQGFNTTRSPLTRAGRATD
jgi:hypothetical protein